MKQTLVLFVFAMAFVFTVNGQNQVSMTELLAPSATNFSDAKNQGFEVFKLVPRGMFDDNKNELSLRGGGAYYSFVKRSHNYNEIPEIELQENNTLSVGFAGADYGMIADLGEISLSELDSNHKSVSVLYNYQPKKKETEARSEFRKLYSGVEINGATFKKEVEPKVGHTYILRAITFDEADTLVAFKVQSRDDDGSLTIFWKPIENFKKPTLIRDGVKPLNSSETPIENIIAKIQNVMKAKGYTNVQVLREDEKIIVLRGTIPSDKRADALETVHEITTNPIRDELNKNQ